MKWMGIHHKEYLVNENKIKSLRNAFTRRKCPLYMLVFMLSIRGNASFMGTCLL
jgi:hypothetical protein